MVTTMGWGFSDFRHLFCFILLKNKACMYHNHIPLMYIINSPANECWVSFSFNYCIHSLLLYLYNANINMCHTVINNMPEPGHNLAADVCMGRTQPSPCIISVLGHSVPTGMPCQHGIIFILISAIAHGWKYLPCVCYNNDAWFTNAYLFPLTPMS